MARLIRVGEVEKHKILAAQFELVEDKEIRPISVVFYDRMNRSDALKRFRANLGFDFENPDEAIGKYFWVLKRPDMANLWVLGTVPERYLRSYMAKQEILW